MWSSWPPANNAHTTCHVQLQNRNKLVTGYNFTIHISYNSSVSAVRAGTATVPPATPTNALNLTKSPTYTSEFYSSTSPCYTLVSMAQLHKPFGWEVLIFALDYGPNNEILNANAIY